MAGKLLVAMFAWSALLAPSCSSAEVQPATQDFLNELAMDDDCASSEEGHCALNALQRRGMKLDRKQAAEDHDGKADSSKKTALEVVNEEVSGSKAAADTTSNATANVSSNATAAATMNRSSEVHDQNGTAPAASVEALAAAGAQEKAPRCEKWTGGSCITSGCDQSRGPTVCSTFKCMCQDSYCAQDGACVFSISESIAQAQVCERSTGQWCLRTCDNGQKCEWGSCMCGENECFKNGACVADWRKLAAGWGAMWR